MYTDYPLVEVAERVERIRTTQPGTDCYQKFTCAGCGARLTIDEPYRFYASGTCDQCGTVTDIAAQGCNFLYVSASRRG